MSYKFYLHYIFNHKLNRVFYASLNEGSVNDWYMSIPESEKEDYEMYHRIVEVNLPH